MNSPSAESLITQVLTISRSDRWLAYHRLQEVGVPCACQPDGSLTVEIMTPLNLVQLRSVIQQITASRTSLVNWLEHCWDAN